MELSLSHYIGNYYYCIYYITLSYIFLLLLLFERYNHRTGEWAHTTRLTKFPERIWLSRVELTKNSASRSTHNQENFHLSSNYFDTQLQMALEEMKKLEKEYAKKKKSSIEMDPTQELGTYDDLRWFILASDMNVHNTNNDISNNENLLIGK
jgi:hypothetical protein